MRAYVVRVLVCLAAATVIGCGDNLRPYEPPNDAALPTLDGPRDARPAAGDGAAGPADGPAPADGAAAADGPPTVIDLLDVTTATYPRVDGSTSNIPLALVIACELLGLPWTWGPAWDEGNGDYTLQVVPDPQTPAQQAIATWVQANIVHHKTHEAYVRLIQDETDFILVASEPSPDERALAASLGVELAWRAVALDALVFLLNQQNPLTGLTTAQVQEIYMARITNWSEVGGPNAAILPYARPENSGSQQLMESLVMEGLTMPAWPPELVATFMGGLVDEVKTHANAVGYSVYYYLTHMLSTDGLKIIAIDGVDPSPATIGAHGYPFTSDVLMVIRADLDPQSLASQLRDWLLTPSGQAVVAMSGYVPVAP